MRLPLKSTSLRRCLPLRALMSIRSALTESRLRTSLHQALLIPPTLLSGEILCFSSTTTSTITTSAWKGARRSRGGKYPNADSDCGDLTPYTPVGGGNLCNQSCYPTETLANNFISLRSMPGSAFGDTSTEFQGEVRSAKTSLLMLWTL